MNWEEAPHRERPGCGVGRGNTMSGLAACLAGLAPMLAKVGNTGWHHFYHHTFTFAG